MANPINPFSGGGGYGGILPSEYQQISSMVGEKFVADENKKIDSLQSVLNSIIGMGAKAKGGDPQMAASLLPSSLNEYYAKASEAQGKAKAYEGLMKTSPELFGLSSDQAKGFADFASKLPPTAVPEFYQLALKGGMAQQELGMKMMAGKKPPLNLEGLDKGFMDVVKGGTSAGQPVQAVQPIQSQASSSGFSPKPISPTVAELDEFDKLHPNLAPGAQYVNTLSKWISQKRGIE